MADLTVVPELEELAPVERALVLVLALRYFPPDRLSTYLLLVGPVVPWAWVLLGFGYAGVCWERATGARLTRTFRPGAIDVGGALYHFLPLLMGLYRLNKQGSPMRVGGRKRKTCR